MSRRSRFIASLAGRSPELELAIGRRLARLMDGDLALESTPGAGPAFTLWLPAVERRARPRSTSARVQGMTLALPPALTDTEVAMLRFLAAGWLTRRLARPLGRAIPNPYLRAAAVAGSGVLVTRLLRKRARR